MSQTYLIADTHFGHHNILKYCNRPYVNTEEMNNDLIDKWNKVVKKDDKVFMLGDFCFKNKVESCRAIGRALKGKKTLILGNHDNYPPSFYYDAGFDYISQYPILYNDIFLLSHKPISTDKPYINIYGHVHDKPSPIYNPNSFCVSVERINYTPINLNKIKKTLNLGRN